MPSSKPAVLRMDRRSSLLAFTKIRPQSRTCPASGWTVAAEDVKIAGERICGAPHIHLYVSGWIMWRRRRERLIPRTSADLCRHIMFRLHGTAAAPPTLELEASGSLIGDYGIADNEAKSLSRGGGDDILCGGDSGYCCGTMRFFEIPPHNPARHICANPVPMTAGGADRGAIRQGDFDAGVAGRHPV